jgi:dolichol-phosphate mannosyltransferase
LTRLSVIIPVYNEERTLAELVARVRAVDVDKQLIAVDDGSSDASGEILEALAKEPGDALQVLRHSENRGKGAAIATGLGHAVGDLVIIQDADLEYDPNDYHALVAPFDDPAVSVVYGSRNLQRNPRSNFSFYWGGRLLSLVANWLYGAHITDEATCYKVFRTELLKEIGVASHGFEFCPEVTAKILRRGIEIREVPIAYHPRLWDEGKKISWQDGIIAVWVLIKYRFKR